MCDCHRDKIPNIRNSKGEIDAHEEWCSSFIQDILGRPQVYSGYPGSYQSFTIKLVDSKSEFSEGSKPWPKTIT